MKLHLNPGTFSAALTVAQTATKRTSLPATEMVLLEAESEGQLRISGTDLESRAWHTVNAVVEEPGAVCLPPKALSDFLSVVIPSEPVTLTVDGKHKAEFISGRTRIRVAGMDPEEFPVCQDFSDPACDLTISGDVLASLIRSVAHAFARDDSRPTLAGILIRVDDGHIQLAAADGYCVAWRSQAADTAPDLAVIVHGRHFADLSKYLSKMASVRLIIDHRQSALLVESEAGCWSIRLLEGDFPDFKRWIRPASPVEVTCDRDALKSAITLVKDVDKVATGYATYLAIERDEIGVRAGVEHGDHYAQTSIEGTLDRGDPMTVRLNTAYLLHAIGALDSPQITLELDPPNKPVYLREAGERNGHLQLIFPIVAKEPTGAAS